MINEYKPKINKGLKVEYQDKVYDKIIYFHVSNNKVSFENKQNESITNNICCNLSEVKISINE